MALLSPRFSHRSFVAQPSIRCPGGLEASWNTVHPQNAAEQTASWHRKIFKNMFWLAKFSCEAYLSKSIIYNVNPVEVPKFLWSWRASLGTKLGLASFFCLGVTRHRHPSLFMLVHHPISSPTISRYSEENRNGISIYIYITSIK